MTQQSETIKSAQETQRANIERIQKQQADAIRKIAEDAKNRRPWLYYRIFYDISNMFSPVIFLYWDQSLLKVKFESM